MQLASKAQKAFSLVVKAFQGRSTMFAIFFAICGTILAFMNKLTGSYAEMITAIQALVVAHSYKEDFFHKVTSDKISVSSTGDIQG